MDANEQNDDEMILVIVGDEDGIVKYEISESQPELLVPISVEIEPRENFKDLYCAEDIKEIFANDVEHKKIIKVKPVVEELDEEHFLQEEYLEEYTQQDNIKTVKTNVSLNKRTPRKTPHKYLLEDEDFIYIDVSSKNKREKANVVSPKNKKRKTKVPQKHKPKPKQPQKNVKNAQRKPKNAPLLKIEFLEDDHSPTPISDDELKVEFLEPPEELVLKKEQDEEPPEELVLKKEQDEEPPEELVLKKEQDEEPPEELVLKKKEDEEYLPEQIDQEEEDEEYLIEVLDQDEADEDNFIEDEYLLPKGKRKPKTPSRKSSQNRHAKKEDRPVKSFILELCQEQPHFKENKEDLIEYLVDYMRKRTAPPPPADYYHLNDDNMYCCSYCDISKPTEAAASRHYQAAHGSRYLVCLACGSGFRSTVILYKHEKKCTGPGATIQLRARGVFLGRKGRGRPYLTKNKFVPREPPPDKKPKRVHIPHAERTKYYCTDCPAYFTREELLEEHMHKHTGFRAFQCDMCPAAYVSRYQLTKHFKKHNNEQFVCDHCGKVFKLKTTLSLHMDTHLPRPRFGCSQCGRRYAKRAAVRSHILRVHMNLPPPAACPVCPKRYNRISNVKIHMKRDHGLILMTQRSMQLNLPYIKVEDLEGAKIVFNKKDESINFLSDAKIKAKLDEQILA